MKNMKQTRFTRLLGLAALAGACTALPLSIQAADIQYTWTNPGVGDWSNPANWTPGVPMNNPSDWDIATINNGGTAVLTTVQPGFEEVQVGNSGVAGSLIITNGGVITNNNWFVVGRTGTGGNTPLSTFIVSGTGQLYKTGDGFIVGDSEFCLGQVIVKDSAQIIISGGWNGIGNGNGGQGWLTLQDNAVYTLANQDWNIGDWGSGRGYAYIKDNATLNVTRFWIGKNGTSQGAVWQTGGAIVGGSGGNEWCIGGQDGGTTEVQGFYSLTSGTFSNPNNFQIGRNGRGLIYQSGGSINASGWTAIGRFAGSYGVVWVSGGQFAHTGTGTQLIVGENGRGEFTLSGTGTLDCTLKLRLGNAGGVGVVNLNNGTAKVPGIEQTGGTGYVNFNGATVQAKADSVSFMGGLYEAVIYAGNAIIDTAGFDVTASQGLLAPFGDGVQSIPVTDGGAGYMSPPVVQIDTSGIGSGATAVAQIDPVAGTVTNIVVTCSGYGYGFVPGVYLLGGGASTPATPGTPTLAAVTSGGVIKNGAGTLTLEGSSTYTGATVVNAGKLVTGTTSIGNGAYTVADSAGLGVILGGSQLNVASVTLGNSALDFDLGNFGNPAFAGMNVLGNMAVNGTVTISVATGLPQLGQFPLIAYGSRTGSGSFVLGTLPIGVVANLVTNGNAIELNVTAVAAPRWEGLDGGNWDIGLTTNWIEISTGLGASYADGNAVIFNDFALGTTSVNLTANVSPSKVTVNNDFLSYTVSGSGKISGATGLTKQGMGSLALLTANDYTGVTRIAGGTVSVTNLANGGQPSAIGASGNAATNLVLANGTLSYSGPAVTVDRGYSIQATNSAIDTQSDLGLSGPVSATAGAGFVKTGPARLTYAGAGVKQLSGGAFPGYDIHNGSVLFDGTAGQTNNSQNEFWVGSTIDNGASIILSNTTLNVDSWFAVGRGNGSVGNISSATLHNSKLRTGNFSMGWDNGRFPNVASQFLTLNGSSTFTNGNDMNLGESGGSTTTVQLNDNAILFSDNRVHLGWHSGGTGVLVMAQSSIMNVDAWYSLGHEGGNGTLTVKDNSKLYVLWDMNITDVGLGDGLMTVQDNAVADIGSLFVGKGTNSVGVLNQTGGSIVAHDFREAHVGFNGQGTWNLSGGTASFPSHWFIVGRWQFGLGEFNVTGGSFLHGTTDAGRLFRVGEDGPGTLNISGSGSVSTACNEVTIGWNADGNGIVNLNGGTFQARRIIGGSGVSAFNFNGGTLRAGPNANSDFMTALGSANVLAGGAIIDSGTNNITIAQSLLDGGGNGGLTKQGSGALYLNGVNTYTGPTTVSAGTLGGTGIIFSSPVTVAAAGNLAPGTSIGVLTINNNLTLNGTTTMEITKDGGFTSSDLAFVGGNLTYGGTLTVVLTGTNVLAVNDTFNLFDWTTRSGSFTATNLPANYTWDLSQLNVDGSIRVAAVLIPPTVNPPTTSGGNLILTGTGGNPGGSYTWLTSTNVTAPIANWTTNVVGTFDGTGAFSNGIPINSAEAARFFRLRTP